MTILAKLKTDLRRDEGTGPMLNGRYIVYDDVTGNRIVPGYVMKGHPTIGIGRALDLAGLRGSEVDALLENDCNDIINNCSSLFHWYNSLSPVRQRVVANMVFQLGFGGFMQFHGMIDCIIRRDWAAAKAAMLNSTWATENVSRAMRLAEWLITDSDCSEGGDPCPSSGT